MWGIHNGLFNHYVGFLPGIKAFTAAVLGGIGNIPGAMMGGCCLAVGVHGTCLAGPGFPVERCDRIHHPHFGVDLQAIRVAG